MSTFDWLSELGPERVRPLKRVEFERLVELGAFEDERVELLVGAIVEMSPRGPSHASAIAQLSKVLYREVGERAEVRVQLSFAASDFSEPEPDLAVVPTGSYRDAHPEAAHLLVEVSSSSLRKDRAIKAPLYAAAGVPEYWIVDVGGQLVERYTVRVNGVYTNVTTIRPGESLRLVALPDVEVPVADIFR